MNRELHGPANLSPCKTSLHCTQPVKHMINKTHISNKQGYLLWQVKNRCNSEIFALLNITQRRVVITEVSGQPIGHIFKDQEIQDDSFLDFFTLENGTDVVPKRR
jgi:hypothetical protein